MATKDIYAKSMFTHKVQISITEVGSNIKEILELDTKNNLEGKCNKDGFIKPNSVQLISYSSGKVIQGSNIEFEVVLECLIAHPVEGMLINCKAVNITKAGIKAELDMYEHSPLIIFISRDHFHDNDYFNSIKEDDKITVRVIGQRYELNDTFIAVIGELVKPSKEYVAPYIEK